MSDALAVAAGAGASTGAAEKVRAYRGTPMPRAAPSLRATHQLRAPPQHHFSHCTHPHNTRTPSLPQAKAPLSGFLTYSASVREEVKKANPDNANKVAIMVRWARDAPHTTGCPPPRPRDARRARVLHARRRALPAP